MKPKMKLWYKISFDFYKTEDVLNLKKCILLMGQHRNVVKPLNWKWCRFNDNLKNLIAKALLHFVCLHISCLFTIHPQSTLSICTFSYWKWFCLLAYKFLILAANDMSENNQREIPSNFDVKIIFIYFSLFSLFWQFTHMLTLLKLSKDHLLPNCLT